MPLLPGKNKNRPQRSLRMEKHLTKDIIYIGVNDHITDLFESQYIIPNGMA